MTTEKQQFELIETRVISNRGVLQRVTDDDYRRFHIAVQLIRPPTTNFVSKKWNPDKSEYAKIVFMREGQVLREETFNYEKQLFVWEVDITGYLAKCLTCTLDGITDLLTAIATQVGLVVVPGERIFCVPINDQFDEIRFVVRDDGAIAVKLYGLKYDIQCENAEATLQPPPPPPNEPTYPPGTDLKDTNTPTSPPYDPNTNDGGNTIPLPDDEAEPEPPPIPDCTDLTVTVQQKIIGFAETTRQYRVFAPFGGFRFTNSGNTGLQAFCKGIPGGACAATQYWADINFAANGFEYVNVISVVETP